MNLLLIDRENRLKNRQKLHITPTTLPITSILSSWHYQLK